METKTPEKKPKTPKKATHELYDWVESILAGLIIVITVLTFLVRGTRVDGGSMLPTLEDAQFLAITHIYSELRHNDIVVVYAKDIDGYGQGRAVIKRVIGLPGDVISIDTQSGKVFRNGSALPIEYKNGLVYEDGHIISDLTRSRSDMPEDAELIVPENSLFIMGDNRNSSKDSRDSSVGMVDENYVIGRVLLRITPFEKFGTVE